METNEARFDWAMAFLAVVEEGSFTRAAERFACSTANISKQVSQLEAALGVQLLFRTTRRLKLTEAGQTYLGYCRRLHDTLDEAERAVSSLKGEVRGKLRISVPTTFGEIFMGELVLAFRARYPEVEIDLDLSRERRDLIADGIDVALRSSGAVDERLVAKPIGVTEEWVVASPDLLARHDSPAAPADLGLLPCILNSHFKDGNRWLFLHDDGQTVVEMRNWLSINSYPLIHHMVLAGSGVARLPLYVVGPDVAAGRLVRLLEQYALPHTPLYVVFPFRQPQPPKVRAFVDFVEAWFRRPGMMMAAP